MAVVDRDFFSWGPEMEDVVTMDDDCRPADHGGGVARKPLPTDATFSPEAHDALLTLLLSLKRDPYAGYEQFVREIRGWLQGDRVHPEVIAVLKEARDRNLFTRPFFFIRNCPLDPVLPVFSNETPVEDKYRLKKTFVTEGFLILFSEVSKTPALAYKNVNDGDRLQDIFPKKSMFHTQSQKTLDPIGFHKDLANHFVRPDFVNILSLRSDPQNEIYTTFVRNCDLLNSLSEETLAVLREPIFYTPFDDLSVAGDQNNALGRADMHPVLIDETDFAFFERRTVSSLPRGRMAVNALTNALHALKESVLMAPGDFVGIANNHSLHGKDVVAIRDTVQQRIRWSMKTVNASDLKVHKNHFIPGQYGVVNG